MMDFINDIISGNISDEVRDKIKKSLADIDTTLSDLELYSKEPEKVEILSIERAKLSDELDECEITWIEKQDELEQAMKE